MAQASKRLSENVPGEFFVDSTCIDCDTCRQIAPAVFTRADRVGSSVVSHQPRSPDEQARAEMALVACPTASIGTAHKRDLRAAARAFPEPIADGVSYCGYASESSFGASSYLIQRPGGNVLVDSPRAAGPLIQRLRALGGASMMFLSHRDDVADHARFHELFGCERILHAEDVSWSTREVERQLEGDAPIRLAEDLLAIPVPGHTRGSCALLYRDTFLFTGDHLWGDQDTGHLSASSSVAWYSWRQQVRSLRRLLDFDFTWVLPGHDRRFHAESPAAMRAELERLLAELA